jgi:hypothetical protein
MTIAIIFGVIGGFLTINLLFSFIYIISFTMGNGFYRWIVHDMDFLMILSFPLFGPTQYVATKLYDRFNWFIARILVICYSILLLILAIVFFYLFGIFAG